MIKLAFKLYAAIAILSPWIFAALCKLGVYNFQYDVLIFTALFFLSAAVMFFTYGKW